MQAHISVGDERIPFPRFSIGDSVVHKVDELNRPGAEWYDPSDPEQQFITWWYRGIITGIEWNCGSEAGDTWHEPRWVYKIRVTEADEPDAIASGIRCFSEMDEGDLKHSRAALKQCCCKKFSHLLKASLGAIVRP